MNKSDLEQRTLKFALSVIQFVNGLPRTTTGNSLGKQLLRSGTSIGANYREANRAESKADFIHKIAIIEKEAAETQYWLELLLGCGTGDPEKVKLLRQEASELLAIFTSIGKTSRQKYKKQF